LIQAEISCWFVGFNHTVDSTSNQAGVVDLRLILGLPLIQAEINCCIQAHG
jgi:hypothetical protein